MFDLSQILLDVDPAVEKSSCLATVTAVERTSKDISNDRVLAIGIIVETDGDVEENSIVGVAGSRLRATLRLSSPFSIR